MLQTSLGCKVWGIARFMSQTCEQKMNIKMFPPLMARLFLNRYVGEIISEAEAEMRQNDAYLFSLDDKVK